MRSTRREIARKEGSVKERKKRQKNKGNWE
jgi:hypothetical protein